ncbi:hypothetical protein [Streptomyces sp. NPDC059008]|uniref:hypothetical protein n=1 Tax=Streptomyces sp. NPDC059008 TaxID=3346693 RepID=UPI0036B12DB7
MREQGEAAACRGRLPWFTSQVADPLTSPTRTALRTRRLRGQWPISAPPRPQLLAPLSVPRI